MKWGSTLSHHRWIYSNPLTSCNLTTVSVYRHSGNSSCCQAYIAFALARFADISAAILGYLSAFHTVTTPRPANIFETGCGVLVLWNGDQCLTYSLTFFCASDIWKLFKS